LRFLIFTTGGIISRTGGYTTIRLSVPEGDHRTCNAVAQAQPI
jgi:hypothetical protein